MSDPRVFDQPRYLRWWQRLLYWPLPTVELEDDGYRVVCKRWRGKIIVWHMEGPDE